MREPAASRLLGIVPALWGTEAPATDALAGVFVFDALNRRAELVL